MTPRVKLPEISTSQEPVKRNKNNLFGVGSSYLDNPSQFSGSNGMSTGLNILRINNIELDEKNKKKTKSIKVPSNILYKKSHYNFPKRSITTKLKNTNYIAKRSFVLAS